MGVVRISAYKSHVGRSSIYIFLCLKRERPTPPHFASITLVVCLTINKILLNNHLTDPDDHYVTCMIHLAISDLKTPIRDIEDIMREVVENLTF